MGIAPYKTFTYDGVSSDTYGVYLTGEGVFNAPERSVEMISIPGRNGDYALDMGKFDNITVTYKAGMYDVNESNFATKIANLRNWLCSKVGYCRLSDDYNPNEYRMGVYSSGLEVDHDMLIAGEFELTFNCKPQRFLTSGETKTTLTSGNTITNPTLFDASPLFEVSGYGTLSIGTNNIVVNNELIGDIVVHNVQQYNNVTTKTITIDDTYANNGDAISIDDVHFTDNRSWVKASVSNASISATGDGYSTISINGHNLISIVGFTNLSFTYGTSATKSTTATWTATISGSSKTGTIAFSVAYNGAKQFTISATVTAPNTPTNDATEIINVGTIILDSTQSVLGNPLYIDLDIGECYKIVNDSLVSVNNGIEMPTKLPTLPSGSTTITFSNTFTSVKVVPRWWIV
jgi:phage-related protein